MVSHLYVVCQIIVYGMLFAMGYIHLRVSKKLKDSHPENLFSRAWTIVSSIVGVFFIGVSVTR